MDDDFDFETVFIDSTDETYSRRFQRTDLIVLGLDLLRGISGAVTSTLTTAQNLAGMHANYRFDQDAFHQEAALEIETLTTGEETNG